MEFSGTAPAATSDAISNFTGGAFDAANIGGSGVNSDGGANNGLANDATTYVATNRAAQGQTFTTGTNPGGYTITSITVQAAGYTNNTATGSNLTAYSLASTSSNFRVRVGKLSGTTFIPYLVEYAASGGKNTPGTGSSANGSGVFLTFTLKAPIVLQPNTVYGFDLGTTGDYFEMLGISTAAAGGTSPYAAGSAFISGSNGVAGGTITPQAGDRVFQVNLTAYTPPTPTPGAFLHPGLLNTEADFDRMRTNVALGQEPWLSNFNALKSSWMAPSGGYNPRAQSTITRSSSLNNSSILYQDIAVAYGSALCWKITGDTAYADQAITILNAWGYTLTAIQGDTNNQLNELYGAELACVGEVMRNYPGWAAADFAQFQTMMYNVFFGQANGFLANHNGTSYDHYWVNWDFAGISALYAIGVLCDNSALTTQATNYFYNGVGNGCIDRAVNFIHPGYLGQGQEMGRDQGHASLDIAQLAAFCQMAWNQGTDLFGYENNRVLAMAEYTAKYNSWQDVPWTNYAYGPNWSPWLQTGPSSGSRGLSNRPGWPTLYNHYVNLKGMSAPYCTQLATAMGTGWDYNGDSLGWDQLTSAQPAIVTGSNPSGLSAMLNGQQPKLSWWGSAYATSYNIKRSTSHGGPYTTIASGVTTNTYTDTNPVAGGTNYYVVTGSLSVGGETGISNEAPAALGCPIYTQLNFNETSGTIASDASAIGMSGTLINGATWTTGKNGNAVSLSKASSQYVTLPQGIVSDFSDITISAWVYQNSATNNARLFDFGSGDNAYGGVDPWGNTEWLAERYMYLAPQDGSGKLRFAITHSAGPGEEGVEGTSALPTGQWVHVCVTLSGGVGTVYVNGVVVGQNVNMPMTPMQFPPTTQNYIGKSQWRNDPYFDGKIDDFRIYRGGLSTAQIYTMATGLTPPATPSAPTTFTITAQPGGSIVLNWSAVSGASSYTVRRSTTPGGPYTPIASLLTGTTYTDTGLAAGTAYYYVVDAANTGGEGTYSAQTSAVALPPIPGAPSSLVATSASSTSVGLIWTAGSNAVSYNVKRALTSGGPYTTVATGVSATTYTDTGLTNGTTYYYVISAVNAAGEGSNSNESNATPSNLLMQLKFDETSGTTAWDTTYHGWNGTTVNGPTWTTGKLGNAINLTSGSSQYVSAPSGMVSGLGDFTVSAWVKMTTQATWQRVFDFGSGTATYMFLSTSNGSVPRFAIRLNNGTEQGINGNAALVTGTWIHMAVTLSGSTGTLYVNGASVGTNTAMTLTPSSLGNTTQNWIGRSQWSADPYLNGLVDDFRIYTRALSASEISSLASSQLASPQNVVATSGYQQVALTWNAVPNATSYVVRSGTVSGGPYTTVASGLSTPGLSLNNLPAGTTYYYVVTAVNAMGEGPNSAEVSAGALATPGAPVGVGVTAGNGTALLTWTTSPDAASYNVYRSSSSGSDYTLLASGITGGAYSDTGMANSSTYYYVVTGVNTGGEGPLSAEVNATPAAAPVITSSGTANGTYGGAFSYQITATNSPTSFAATGLPSGLSVNSSTGVISGIPLASGTYNATISAFNVGGSGSAALTISVQVAAPSTPTGLTASRGDATAILSWSAASGAASYNVKRSLTSGTGYTTVASNVTTLNFTNTGLTNGTTYYYVVSAVNSAGESANSSQVSVAPASATADWFTQQFTSGNSTANCSFTFTPANNINKYIVSRRTGVTQFPTSTSGATTIAGGDDISTKVTLSGTSKVMLYGVNYSSFYIGSNGYLTFTASDTSWNTSLNTHFNQPRISPLFDDLDSTSQGTMSWIQLSDRVAVTWLNVPQYNTSNSNNFQVEMFFDGRIRITCLALADTKGLIGLSGTTSKPTGFTSSTFSNYPAPLAAPGGLTASGSNSAIALKWNSVTGATTYNVKRTLTSGSNYATIASGVTSTSYIDTGLTNGTPYYYIVSAVNSVVGEGIDSTQTSATPLAPPPVPTGLITTSGSNLVALSWNAASGATSYSVWRSNVSGSGYTLLDILGGTSFIDATAVNGTTYYYVVTSSNDTATSGYSTEVAAAAVAPPTITSSLNVTGINGSAFSYQITASNNPTSFAATGLPTGLSVDPTTGLITGTPTISGNYSVTISATNFSGTGTATLNLTVYLPAPVISSALSASGTLGTPFSYQILATNSPTSYAATGLPSGLSVDSVSGVISGTPTGSGTSNVTISAINAGGTGSATLVITIALPLPVITSSSSSIGTVGFAFNYQVTATNNPSAYNVAGTLPAGLSFNSGSGIISGTPTASGTSSLVVSATNAYGSGTAGLTITILPPQPAITSATSVTGTGGAPFSYQITATNNPTGYDAIGLPAGLAVNTANGLISGTPTVTGTLSTTLLASNASGSGTAALSITLLTAQPLWTGGGADNNWFNGANWTVLPVTAENLAFGGSIQTTNNNNFAAGMQFGSVLFNSGAGAFTLGGNGISLSGSLANNSSNTQTINLGVVLLGSNQAFTAASGNLVMGGAISGTGGINVNGSRMVTLTPVSGSNTYSGATLLSSGTLEYQGTTSMSGSSALTVSSGAVLSLRADADTTFTPASLTLTNGGTMTIQVNSLNSPAGNGHKLTLANTATTNGASNTTINITGTTGDTLAFSSSFQIPQSGSAWGGPTANFNLSGGNVILNGMNGNDGGLILSSTTGNSLTINGNVSVTSNNRTNFAQVNSGTLILNDTLSGSYGSTNWGFQAILNGGVLALNNSAAINGNSNGGHNTLLLNSGTLVNTSGAALTETTNPTITLNGSIAFSTGTSTSANNLNLGSGAVNLAANSTITTNGAATLTLGGAISSGNSSSLTKAGTGTLALNGANSFSGGMTISGGSLNLNGSLSGSGTVNVNSGAMLSGTGSIAGPVIVSGTIAPGNGGAITSGSLSVSGSLTFNNGALLSVGLSGTTNSGQIVAGNSVTATGTTTVNLAALAGFAGAGIYPILSSSGAISAGNFAVGTIPNGYGCFLNATGGTLYANIVTAPVITSTSSITGTAGAAFSYQITATNSPTSYAATGLPAGLAVNTSTGLINGTPSATGTTSTSVSATNGAGTGSATLVITILPQAPAAPTSLSATGSNTQVSLAWAASSSASSYNVKRSTTNGSGYSTVASGVTLTSYTDTGLTNGTTYFYVVTAVNAGGESANSPQANATPQPPVPVISSATSVSGIAGSSFTYQITATNNPTTYAASGLPAGLAVNPSSGLISGTPSATGITSASISATNGGGTGTATLVLTILPPVPTAPATLTATGSNGVVSLTWAASSGATSYNVKRSGTSGSGYTTVANNVTLTNYTDPGLTNGTTYYYVVTAVNAGGESANSPQASATPQPPIPVIISATSVTGTSGSAFSYQITASNIPTGYSASGLPAGLALNTSSGLISGTPSTTGTTSASIGASNGGGTGTATLVITILPPAPAAPASLNATSGNAQVSLGWPASSGATSYNVKRSGTNGSGYTLLASTMATSYIDTSVSNDTTYYYVVSAINAGGESANSQQASATPSAPITTAELSSQNAVISGSTVTLTINSSVIGHTYQLQYADSLTPNAWQNYGASQVGNGGTLIFTAPRDSSVAKRFYRIQILQ